MWKTWNKNMEGGEGHEQVAKISWNGS